MATAQAGHNVTFELHSLGWYSFQQLALTILSEVLGQDLEQYSAVHDAGMDGAWEGPWSPNTGLGEQISGSTIIQAKFVADPSRNLTLSSLNTELPKIQQLISTSQCDSYVVITNAGLTGHSRD